MSGSIQSEQLCLDLLHSVNYSIIKAKFYLLFPTLAKSKPSPLSTLPEEELQKQVNDALHDLMGYKKEEQTKLISRVM